MAFDPSIAVAIANEMLDQLGDAADSGKLRIYDGSQPATADTAITDQNLLVEMTMNSDAFPAASGGVLNANPISIEVVSMTGTASWFRLFESDGTTVLYQGSAGVGEFDLVLTPSASLTAGKNFEVTLLTISLAALLVCP